MAEIVKPELSINKKLGNVKFEQAFDTTTIAKAEKVVAASENVFKEETLKDFSELGALLGELNQAAMNREQYEKFSAISFSIKSRAQTGGFPLASSVANSLYKFCDRAAEVLPVEGYKAIKLHYDALTEVFDNKFSGDDADKAQKLVDGLEAIAGKFINE